MRRRNEKELKRRTQKKNRIKAARAREIKYNQELKESSTFNKVTKQIEFKAPLVFSFIKNPNETSAFFENLISFITTKRNYGKNLFIDISNITELTIDALMYLLAIINNLNENFNNKYSFSGNFPKDPKIRDRFHESGFYRFVKYRGKDPLVRNKDNVQIVSGENSDVYLAKRIASFVSSKAKVPQNYCRFIYCLLVELMSNTHKHAYNNTNRVLYPRWYCYAEYDKRECISFTFMDTGEGIPSTVKKNFSEKLDILKIKEENRYVISALDGEFRTATKKPYRGKGLPRIREFCSSEKIKDMQIITNKANVIVNKQSYVGKDMAIPLTGTLYYWKIDLRKLKGECII